MESTENQSNLLHQILPPRLEDAALEDPALPPELIHEAFLKAAAAVKSGAVSIFSGDDGCIDDPKPTEEDFSDVVDVNEPENEAPGPCVDGLQGLEIKEKEDLKESEEKEKKEKEPILVGSYV
ncbi:unnamed protein product [Vicia faba]|uniref:Uncharacterized protein n=1 Tax=Vicia faba TaxID=3906 RepID=A0AAV0ZW64_VICFA|nr:unnamed protein product [Vicia faba]